MATIHLGIALFWIHIDSREGESYFHWAVVATETNWTTGDGIQTYDIAPTLDRKWEQRVRYRNLAEDHTFCGIVEFATTDLPADDVDEFIRDRPSEDDGLWRIQGPQRWSSPSWVLKIMCDLDDAEVWDIPTEIGRDGLFDVVVGKGFVMLEISDAVEDFPVLFLGFSSFELWPAYLNYRLVHGIPGIYIWRPSIV
ncbi:hypothetical protein EDD18DRAFT_1390683 [Armillaria luteobubalina]|uniref:Uncharacterized protein n=1 Tax=Armillaria luteobubalina TaxID=153913 RepID=A0AA39Q6G5_9AGAR|nr:hypothetical protein EDD18DRAFT_1390683 [Armillaria luteobubalina]